MGKPDIEVNIGMTNADYLRELRDNERFTERSAHELYRIFKKVERERTALMNAQGKQRNDIGYKQSIEELRATKRFSKESSDQIKDIFENLERDRIARSEESYRKRAELAREATRMEAEQGAERKERYQRVSNEIDRIDGEQERNRRKRAIKTRFAVAAALASLVKLYESSIREAAQENETLARSLANADREKKKLFTNIGNDLAPFASGLEDAAKQANNLYNSLYRVLALFSGGDDLDMANAKIQRNIAKVRKEAFDKDIAAQNLSLKMTADSDGPGSQEAKDQRALREFNKQLSGLDPRDAAALRERFIQKQSSDKNNRDKESLDKQSSVSAETRQRILDARVEFLSSDAESRPKDYEAFVAASIAKEEAERQRIYDEIYSREGVSRADKDTEFGDRSRVISRESFNDRVEQKKKLDDQEREVRIASRMLAIERQQNQIEIVRAQGLDELADKAQIGLDFARDRLEIETRQGLTEADRARFIQQLNELEDLKLAKLGNPDKTSIPGIESGLAGGQTLIRQLVGANGLGARGEDPVVTNGNRTNKLLETINTTLQNGTVGAARAG